MANKSVIDPLLELKVCKRELLAKVRQLTTRLCKAEANIAEFKRSLAEKEKELKIHRAKAAIPQISGIQMRIVYPEIVCPFCHKPFKPKET